MTFLELVQRAWKECGLSGPGPTSTDNQSDMHGRMVQYVKNAYEYVQQQHQDWAFHWNRMDGSLVVDQSNYNLGDFAITSFRSLSRVLLADDNGNWSSLDRDRDANEIDNYDNLNYGKPSRYILLPDGTIQFNTIPDATYSIRIEYYRDAHELDASSDTPLVPDAFQSTIIYKAVEYYSYFDEDAAMNMLAKESYASALHRLQRSQLPELIFEKSSFT